jgi:serine/threonine protein kinase
LDFSDLFLPPQSLLELHKRRKALTEPEARYYLRQIVLGCQYLHRNQVIHRDLKLGNLFLNEDLEVKIGEVLGLRVSGVRAGGDKEGKVRK